ncbi:MAG: hypothetical protein QW165_01910 [Candidatus Woesearchaeota archaeon]
MYGMSNYSVSSGYGSNNYLHSPGCSNTTVGYSGGGYSARTGRAEYTQPEVPNLSHEEHFLAENRPLTPIISNLGEVKEIVEQTFQIITGQEFPHDSIKITICEEKEFRQISPNKSTGVVGFSYNKYGKGISEIYIKQDHLDSVLLTIGHELGHVLGPTLPNKQDEEAKAHAFSLTWIETIRDNNIGGLQPNIAPNPAHNGLHDVAFDFVKYLLHTGSTSFEIFKTLARGLTSIIAR